MKLVPFENITYTTQLGPDEIQKRIHDIIEPPTNDTIEGASNNKEHKPYEGRIENYVFEAKRVMGFKNSFLPTITGTIERQLTGTKIRVKMKLKPMIIWFITISLFSVGVFGLFTLYSVGTGNLEPIRFIPFALPLFLYAITTGGFTYENFKSKKYFQDLFEARMKEY